MNQFVTVADSIERILITGDLERLTPDERVNYYAKVCESIGLNPLTRPFDYIKLNGKLTLYAKRECADQLRKINGISVAIVGRTIEDDLLTVTARATDKFGRTDEDCGVVAFPAALRGEARANAALKAITKAKRRVTLSISGLGWLDETEVETIPEARRIAHRDPVTGERQVTGGTPHDNDGVVLEDGIPEFLDRRDSAAIPQHPPIAADSPAPSPPQESSAGEDMGPDPKDMFIQELRAIIGKFTDAAKLSRWWNSAQQKQMRDDFELSAEERKELQGLVMDRRDALMKETTQ